MKYFSILFFVFFLTVTGCSSHQNNPESESAPSVPAPATFTGRIPCADCYHPYITLNFRLDGLYQLRKTNVKGKARDSIAEIGRWQYDPLENRIILGEKDGALKSMTLLDNDTLRLLDVEDKENPAKQNYDLHKADTLDPFTDPVRMRGMYSYLAGTGTFTECQSGVRFFVAPEQDNLRLEHSYNTTPRGQGESLLVLVEGSLVPRPKIKGSGEEELLVVERFHGIFPDQDCSGDRRQAELFNTTWRLAELDGKPVALTEGQREPFFILEIENNKMHGFSGCNRFFGTYLIKGEIFVFNKIVTTRMACVKDFGLENSFLMAIRKTEAYSIRGDDMLELRDRDEQILARLKATK